MIVILHSKWHTFARTFLLFLGIFVIPRFLFRTSLAFAETLALPGKSLKKFGSGMGSWAGPSFVLAPRVASPFPSVVTGASDGIGKEFASAGFNILLVAQNQDMLSDVADEIAKRTERRVESKIYLIDFLKNDPETLDDLKTLLESLDIGVLGMCSGPNLSLENIDIINIDAMLSIAHAVLPGMIQSRRGLILVVGSFAGLIPTPLLATYSGSRAFVSTFTSALAEEVKRHNIVVTKMSSIRKSSFMIPIPAAYVRATLSKIGLACGTAMMNSPNTLTP
ncbi:hypothetical protein SCLCIDRAFT_16376 [Scleroderma citrinum Foug A]|uniref:3-ketoacyl-CoA reductase n=1 Tax=Scleroderma citrinum Foug A TaxID=1036808 RepID=A0A0C2ZEX1_9AGAM|nr:hypothetical protein SCLCIDRAFT_16376 [Scleroderma citrinum Foug A]